MCLIKIVELDEDLGFLMVGKEYIARYEHLVKIVSKITSFYKNFQ